MTQLLRWTTTLILLSTSCLSRLRLATKRFSLPFSCSSSFSRRAWSTFNQPYSLRQRLIRLLYDPRFFARLRCRLPVRHRHFHLPQQIHDLFRLIYLPRHFLGSSCPVSLFPTGSILAGHSIVALLQHHRQSFRESGDARKFSATSESRVTGRTPRRG